MKQFKFFHGHNKKQTDQETWLEYFDRLEGLPTVPNIYHPWSGTTYIPSWNPNWFETNWDRVRYNNERFRNYTTLPNYTITTSSGTGGTLTIPSITNNIASGYSLTTSNPNGITYTTTGTFNTLSTGTATYSSSSYKS